MFPVDPPFSLHHTPFADRLALHPWSRWVSASVCGIAAPRWSGIFPSGPEDWRLQLKRIHMPLGTVQIPGSTVEFFNQRALDYRREYNQQTPGGYALRVRRDKVLRLFDKPGGKVLDVGCGPGAMAKDITDLGCDFWGVDPSEKMLDICRQQFDGERRMRFISGDASQLAMPDEHFDAVLCMGVMDMVPEPRRAISEMLRVLKTDGTLIITFTNLYSPYACWKKYVFYPVVAAYHKFHRGRAAVGNRPSNAPDARTRTLYTKKVVCRLLEAAGATVLNVSGYYFNICLSPVDELLPRTALILTRKLEENAWPRPEWIASGWIVKARKTNCKSECKGNANSA